MEKTKTIQILGAGGHAKVVVDAWTANGGHVQIVADDDPLRLHFLGMRVARQDALHPMLPVVVTIGDNRTRLSLAGRLANASFATVVHPSAFVSITSTIGQGSVVLAGAIINPHVVIGTHSIINTGAVIEHDCILEDGVHVAPGAVLCGGVSVGLGTLIGAGAVIIPGKKIGTHCIIGAGAVVLHDLPDNAVAVGNPAKIIRTNQ